MAGTRVCVRRAGKRLHDHEAILAPGRDPLTFAGLCKRIAAIRDDLGRLGLRSGDRIAIAARNGPDPVVCCLGVMTWAVAAPIDPALAAEEVRRYFARILPKALIIPAGLHSAAREVARAQGIPTIELASDAAAPAGTFTLVGDSIAGSPPRLNEGDDAGLLLLTSGSTARSKIVPVKHRHVLAFASNINTVLGYGPSDRTLHLMPLFHGAGLNSSLLVPLLNGASVVCVDGFETSSFYAHLDRYRPTVISAGFAMHRAILDSVDAHRDVVSRSRLRFLRRARGDSTPRSSAAWKLRSARRWSNNIRRRKPARSHARRCRPRTASPAVSAARSATRSPSWATTGPFSMPDADGEIVVRGPSVFDGYLDDPEANAAAFVDGWFRTGDLGRLDARRLSHD